MTSRKAELGEWQALAILQSALGSGPGPSARKSAKKSLPPKSSSGAAAAAAVRVGIGDDAAVLDVKAGALVWATDACLEGVHYKHEWLSAEDLAWKSIHAAVSDVAAMAARPVGILCHVTLPRSVAEEWLRPFARGQKAAAEAAGCAVVGGNLARGPRLDVVTTVLGDASKGTLLRSGAAVGDEVWLVGEVGRARLGLRLLEKKARVTDAAGRACLTAFRRPRAQIAAGIGLLDRATACLDVSDGLVGDAGHLARASEVALVLSQELVLETASDGFVRTAMSLDIDPLDALLFGGEDYALLATGPKLKRPKGAQVLGHVEAGQGVWLDVEGEPRRELSGGFEHGR